MDWKDQLMGDSVAWLLEEADPGVRYLALRDLEELPAEDPVHQKAMQAAHTDGPIGVVLDQMDETGYWVKPGHGYSRKYRSTVWALIMLGQMGASVSMDARIETSCHYLLENAMTANGQFSIYGSGAPSGTIDCLQGNLLAALLSVGFNDPRLDVAFEWMARSITGEGVASQEDKTTPIRYYQYKSGPGFTCKINGNHDCAWGGIKEMLAFSYLPIEQRTPLMERAINRGADILFSVDPETAKYPTKDGKPPSRNWWKFGFPVFYISDMLQNVEAMVGLGYGNHPRLTNALDYIREKQDEHGRWSLDYDYNDRTWFNFGEKKQPNKWVTYRAIRVLKEAVSQGYGER